MRYLWIPVSRGLVLAVGAIVFAAAARSEPLSAPYQVDGLVQYRNDISRSDSGLGLDAPRVAVDLGNAEGKPHPGNERLQVMTVLGTAGTAYGQLEDLGKDCSYLCGDEAESCHYRVILTLDRAIEDLGTPLVAFAGRHETTGYQALDQGSAESVPSAALESEALAPPVWTTRPASKPSYRIRQWDPDGARLTLDQNYGSNQPTAIEDHRCELRRHGPLTGLQCSGLALLAAESRVLLFSYPDYNMPAAEPVARFGAGGIDYTLVRLGIKAQTVFGLLFQQGGTWQARFRQRDYALLC